MIGDGMEAISEVKTLDEVIKRVYGADIYVADRKRAFGGDINEAFFLKLSDGQLVFLKENEKRNKGFFSAEVEGLKAIAETNTIGVPTVHAYGIYGDKSFLLMENLKAGDKTKDFWECFGHELANMHRASSAFLLLEKRYGFHQDNYIGAGFQKNTGKDFWIEFFRDCRLLPQVDRARQALSTGDIRRIEKLMEHLDNYLIEPEHPSVLHGDLWSGNFLVGPDGKAWLIDPAVYVGCSEADIAMTELFGGFSGAFYSAYRESGLLLPGYEDRRDLYNLYHMLNHLNLFGGSYLYAVERIISRYQ